MYTRGTTLGRNIRDDGRIHLPPGYNGNAFNSTTIGKIHPPEQRLYTSTRHHTETTESESPSPEEKTTTEQTEYHPENIPELSEIASAQDESPDSPEPRRITKDNANPIRPNEMLTELIRSLGREEWLLIVVTVLLLADGSDAWDIIILLLLLLGVH